MKKSVFPVILIVLSIAFEHNAFCQKAKGFPSGDIRGHEFVDLGLSVLWASCNVGAGRPEEYGDYYAWGEISAKSSYSWGNYKYFNGQDGAGNRQFSKYSTSYSNGAYDRRIRLNLSDDVAHQRWGGEWRLPTMKEAMELMSECKWERVSVNGHAGFKITGENGKSIFLPAAGRRSNDGYDAMSEKGYYWSSSLSRSAAYRACIILFTKHDKGGMRGSSTRDFGLPVRAVSD